MIRLVSLLKSPTMLSEQTEQTQQLGDTHNLKFDSGRWKASSIKDQLQSIVNNVERLVSGGGTVTAIKIEANESKVPNYNGEKPNPKQHPLEPGQLAKLRAESVKRWLESNGLGEYNIVVQDVNVSGPEWQQGNDADDEKYREHQWVRVAAMGTIKNKFRELLDGFGITIAYNPNNNTMVWSTKGYKSDKIPGINNMKQKIKNLVTDIQRGEGSVERGTENVKFLSDDRKQELLKYTSAAQSIDWTKLNQYIRKNQKQIRSKYNLKTTALYGLDKVVEVARLAGAL